MRRSVSALLLAGIIAATGILAYWISRQRDEAKRLGLVGRICQLELALKSYHADYGAFPPASYQVVPGGPKHSWRVLLLPYLDLRKAHEEYRFDEPWDSPRNCTLANSLKEAPLFFRSPYSTQVESMYTDFVAVDGRRAMPYQSGVSIVVADDVQFYLAESPNSGIHWMEPRDE